MLKSKFYNVSCPTEIYDSISRIIENAEYCRKTYFWHPSPTASQRREAEEKYSISMVSWCENGDIYTAEFYYHESCNHVYSRGYYTKNGEKTNLRAIKNSFLCLTPKENCHDIFYLN